MKRMNQKQTLDNLERQNVLFHKVKILLQNDPQLADTYLRYMGNYTKAYVVTKKFLLDMHDIKCQNEICPSPLKDTNDSDSGDVQGPINASERENDGTATSFGATMFGVVYNATCACPDNAYDPWMYSYNLNTEGPHSHGYHDPPQPSSVGYSCGDDGSNIVHNIMGGLSYALGSTATSHYSNTTGYSDTNIKPQQTYTTHVTIPQTHEQTPPPKHPVRSHSPDIYMAPPPTLAPSSSQAQYPTPLIPAGTVRSIAASTTMIIRPKNGTCPCLG